MELIDYPNNYEFLEVFTKMTSKSFVQEFTQSKGVFYLKGNQYQISKDFSELYLEYNDFRVIKDEAERKTVKNVISGFEIKVNSSLDLPDYYDNLITGAKFKKELVLDRLVKKLDDSGAEYFQGSVTYKRPRVGKIKLLQFQETSFKFNFKKKSNELWVAEIISNNPNDSIELSSLLSFNGKHSKLEISQLQIEKLSTSVVVDFFDEIAQTSFNPSWEINDIKQLTIRKGDNENISEVPQTELLGIRQAILEGINLRDNDFVVNSIKHGYKFTSMVYEFVQLNGKCIELKAEFKSRPKVFEISLISSKVKLISGIEVSYLENSSMSKSERIKICSEFWNYTYKIYNNLIKT